MQAKNNNKQSCNSYINCNTALIVKPEKKTKTKHTHKKRRHIFFAQVLQDNMIGHKDKNVKANNNQR